MRRLSLFVVASFPTVGAAQLRWVAWITLDGPTLSPTANFPPSFQPSVVTPVNAVAKRPDVVTVQEQSSTSTAGLAAMLNSLYGVGSYVAVQPAGQTATDRLGYVYDSTSVDLIGSASVIPSNGTRPHLRSQFRPVGYTSPAASLWVYTSHLNASSATTRAAEAAALRANVDALPAGSHVLTTGDYNIDSSNETSYLNLTGAGGTGRVFDPLNRPGTWNNNVSFADIHTQSTRVAQVGGGASGGMDDRFDFQLASGAMVDGEGLSYIGPTAPGTAPQHSYRAFGNGGNTFNGNINDPQNTSQPPAVLDALYNASDHLPVVADYQVPARMAVTVAPVPGRVIVG